MTKSPPGLIPRGAALVQPPSTPRAWTVTLLGLAVLYLLGAYHWMFFFNLGRLPFKAYDWPKEYMYLAVLQESLREGRIPFHVSVEFHLHTKRFLALPETLLSPQIFLLPLFSQGPEGIGRFVLFDTLLLYSAGFAGCLLLGRRYQLSLLPWTTLVLLFLANGYITSHLSVGHFMWNAYFLLPFFCLFLLEMLDNEASLLPALKLAMLLFVMNLQGGFHMVIWCWMFIGLLVLFEWKLWRQGLVVLGLSGLLSAFRLLPAMITFWDFKDYQFLTGYPTLIDLWHAFVTQRAFTYPYVGGKYGSVGWWEFDVYVGLLGLGMLVYFGIVCRLSRNPVVMDYHYPALDLPLVVLTILSLSYLYAFVAMLPLPLVNGERVSARFLIIPVVLVLVLAVVRMQRLLEKARPKPAVVVLLAGSLAWTFFLLANHTSMWRVMTIEKAWEQVPIDLHIDISNQNDPLYVASVLLSLLVSLAALGGWVYLWRRGRRQERLLLCAIAEKNCTGTAHSSDG